MTLLLVGPPDEQVALAGWQLACLGQLRLRRMRAERDAPMCIRAGQRHAVQGL
jgi:hypothetical protein